MSGPLLVLWLHVLGVVGWIGGLLFQAHVLGPGRGGAAALAEAASRARPATWSAIGLVALTGFYNVTRLGPVERVLASGAGLLLAGKFMLVLVMVALAAQRDFAQVPRLRQALGAHEDPGPALGAIARLDRLVLLLAALVVYLGLAISRA